MVSVYIVGEGSHAKMLRKTFLDSIKTCESVRYSSIEDKIPLKELYPLGRSGVIIGVGNKPTLETSDLSKRKELFLWHAACCLKVKSNYAILLGKISTGSQLMPGAVINYGAMVRENTIINTAAVVEHDCDVGAHCHIAPNATLCGGVKVGELTHIGAGSVVLQGIKIGSGCVVGAGSVVTKDMPDNTTWIGTKFHDRV